MGNLTCTASGSVANFYTPYAVPIRSFKVHFSPKQSGSGDPSPTNVRPIEGWTGVAGYRDKKSVVWNQMVEGYLTSADWQDRNSSETNTTFADGVATIDFYNSPGSYHTLLAKEVSSIKVTTHKYYGRYEVNANKDGLSFGIEYINSIQQYSIVTNYTANTWRHVSTIRDGLYDRNRTFYAPLITSSTMQEGLIAQVRNPFCIDLTLMFGEGNEPETPEEFEAQCALNGIDLSSPYHLDVAGTVIGWKTANTDEIPISFPAVGKNLYDEVSYPFTDGKWITSGSGNINDDNPNLKCTEDFIPFEMYAGLTITLNKRPSGMHPGFAFYSEANRRSFISGEANNNTTAGTPWTITVPEGTKYMRFTVPVDATDIQIELGSISTEYEVYKGNTFYGGYVDLVSGELVQEYDRYVFTGSEDDQIIYSRTEVARGSEKHIFSALVLDRIVARNSTNMCFGTNALGYYSSGANSVPVLFYVGTPSKQIGIYIDSTLCEPTVESFCEWLSNNNMEFVYLLGTPITHTLSSQTLSTLVHSNAFWSNADSVEIEYDLAECGDIKEIRRRILLNTPHLETVSGSVAHFSTDMAAKLKELKVNFLPQQAGSGDPSPSNVRAISGWTGCDVVRSGKNLFDENACRFGYWTNSSGVVLEANKGVLSANIPINPNQAVSLSFYGASPYSYSIIELDENLGFLFRTHKSIQDHSIVSPGTLTLTTGASTRYIYIQTYNGSDTTITQEILASFKLQLELGSESTAYEPYQSNQITVSWANLGTIYGGFIDVLRGELVQEWEMISQSWGDMRSGRINETTGLEVGVARFTNYVKRCVNAADYGVNTISNITGRVRWEGISYSPEHYYIVEDTSANTSIVRFSLPSTLANDTVIQIAARLETPITYPLTPETIKANKGVNNVWSDAGDVSVRFWTH